MSNVDDLFRSAQSLKPDDRLQLISRLWSSLTRSQRAELILQQLEGPPKPAPVEPPEPFAEFPVYERKPFWPVIQRALFDPTATSGLYSAPRRFDLATIFVVTAAYSLFFGGLTAIWDEPWLKITLGLLVTVVAVTQAMFAKTANPRGVSIVTGAAANTVASIFLWSIFRRDLPEGAFIVVVIYGFIGGAFLGYLAGVLVGGVFLVADMVRKKIEGRSQIDSKRKPAAGPD